MENAMTLRFDKHRFVKKLKESGQAEEQAEALADAFDEALEQSQSPLATKQDLKQEILVLRSEFKQEISQLETRLTEALYKMAGFIILGVGAILGIFKFFG